MFYLYHIGSLFEFCLNRKKKRNILDQYKEAFIYGSKEQGITGCVNNEIDKFTAEKVWNDMEKFAGYAFNKSHAVAYSYHTVRTAWLALYYPVEYFCAVLNSYLGTAEKITEYITVCKEKGIQILPPSINESVSHFSNNGVSIRFGLGGIKYVGSAEMIIDERQNGDYKSFSDFLKRILPNKRVIEYLVKAGAFDEFGGSRKSKLDNIKDIVKFVASCKKNQKNPQDLVLVDSGEFDLTEKYQHELDAAGVYVSGHPLEEYQKSFTGRTIKSLSNGEYVKVLGIVKNIETKRAKRTNKAFLTFQIEDQTGSIKAVYFDEDYDKLLQNGAVLKFEGKVKTDDFGTQLTVNNYKKANQGKVTTYYFKNQQNEQK